MATLGLSMITRNEMHTLPACLKSVQGLVSQIVIADTGSTDRTHEVAAELGATIISVPWENHYAQARNAALQHMTTDWVLSLDADEELDPEAKTHLPGMLGAKNISAYMLTIRDYMPGKSSYYLDRLAKTNDSGIERARLAGSFHDQQTIRLFRRDPEIYYIGRVHELVEYRICSLGLQFLPAPLLIHHFGHLRGKEVRDGKNLLYRQLGQMKVKEEADNPFAWFELGLLEYQAFHDSDAALRCFRKVVELHPPFTRAWLFIAMIEVEKGRPGDALTTLQHTENTTEAAGLRERVKGDALHNLGRMAEARACYQRALELNGPDPMILSKLGYTEVRLGQWQEGLAKLNSAVEAVPQQVEIHDRLVKAHILTGNLEEAASAAERFAACIRHPKTFLRAASIRAQLQQWDRAQLLLTQGLEFFPDSPELRSATMEISTQKTTGLQDPTLVVTGAR